MFCKNCGSQVRDDARFCATCGAATVAAEQPQAAPASGPVPGGWGPPPGQQGQGYGMGSSGYDPQAYGAQPYGNPYGQPGYGQGAVVGTQYAGFWRRFAAVLIDGIIIGVISSVIGALVGSTPGEVGAGTGIQTLLGAAYMIAMLSQNKGQTLGGMALSLRVVDANGQPPAVGAAVIRYLMSLVSGFALLIGYLWMLWDKNKQTWHDKVANTYVVKV